MKEGLFIKLNWLVYRRAILNHLAILSKENPKELYKEARRIYKQEMKQLPSKIVKNLFANTDMTCAKRIKNETKRAERSEKATHPYTWQYKISDIGDKRFTAKFSRCGIYDYFTSKGLEQLVPAMCLMDYSFCEVQNHIFLRKETLATGGRMCDCTYINKDVATEEELQNYEDDMKNEAKRGGIML